MSRREFSDKVKAEAFLRAAGHCENLECNARLTIGKFHYDHDVPDNLGGEPVLSNCSVLCVVCHKAKTKKQDMPRIAKTRRIIKRERGIKKPRTMTRWRKFNGDEVRAPRAR